MLALPAGQESTLQSKLGCGEVVLYPIIFLPNQWLFWNIILLSKQMSPHWLFCPYACWAVHFWARPMPDLSYSPAICWIGWSFWTAVLPLAQYGSSVGLGMWGGLFQGSQIPPWVQHKRKLLIRVKHPVCRQTVYLFSDGATRKVWLWDMVGYNQQFLCWCAFFPWPVSLQWITCCESEAVTTFFI